MILGGGAPFKLKTPPSYPAIRDYSFRMKLQIIDS